MRRAWLCDHGPALAETVADVLAATGHAVERPAGPPRSAGPPARLSEGVAFCGARGAEADVDPAGAGPAVGPGSREDDGPDPEVRPGDLVVVTADRAGRAGAVARVAAVRADEAWAMVSVLLVVAADAVEAPPRADPAPAGAAPADAVVVGLADADEVLLGVPGPDELRLRIAIADARRARAVASGPAGAGSAAADAAGSGAADVVRVDGLEVDLATHEARVDGRTLPLTHLEYELLRFLSTHRGRAFGRGELLERVWGHADYGRSRTVDVHVRRLRAKLGPPHAERIRTVRSVGYRFEA